MAPVAISLLTIPIYLKLIGEVRYGVLAIAWLLLGYFGFFDLGLGRATTQRIGSLRSGDESERVTVFWTALAVNLGMGGIGALVIWPIAHFAFSCVVDMDTEFRVEMLASVPWLALMLPFASLSGVLSGALAGREKFLELNVVSVIGGALFQVLPLLAVALFGPDLRVIMPAVLLSRTVTLIVLFGCCLRHVAPRRPPSLKKAEAIRLLKFGGWVTVTSVVGPMMVILDRMIIGIVSGAAAVTYYTVPFQLVQRTGVLPSSLASALFPRFSAQEEVERVALALDAQRAMLAVMTPLSIFGILMIEPFLSIWISPSFANIAATVGIILIAGFWPNHVALVPYALLQARGRPDLVAKVHVAELIPYLAMLYFGLVYWGLNGAAIAFSLRAIADTLLLSWMAGQFRTLIRKSGIPAFMIGAAVLVAFTLQFGSITWIVSATALVAFACFHGWVTAPPILKNKGLDLFARRRGQAINST